ncbi:hypothetical protein IE53DRAFT_374726 [Violaceomyces palustris]|uniref:Uncharacterized protein n=1 Tax=Violaceomyces palustris TaxID=1673888 RepID=A0ACD0NWN2_9BASI|nr:hypothetical protein IE53DRAFT_374726 [Violaceomyces palustris]
MRSLARIVHVSFRRVEKAADWLTGSAGPVFVTICTVLVLGGSWTFFTAMFPSMAPIPSPVKELLETRSPAHVALGLIPTSAQALRVDPITSLRFGTSLFSCLFIVWSIAWHYYMACTEPPGSVLEGLGDDAGERRSGVGSTIWWERYRLRAARASGPPIRRVVSSDAGAKVGETFEPASPIRPATSAVNVSDVLASSIGSLVDVPPSPGKRIGHAHHGSDLVLAMNGSPSTGSRRGSPFSTPKVPRSQLPLTRQDSESQLMSKAQIQSLQEDDYRPEEQEDEGDDDTFPLARMCHKCDKVTLAKALITLPPELRRVERQLRRKPNVQRRDCSSKSGLPGSLDDDDEIETDVRDWLGPEDSDKLVPPPKPERSHHCRVCKTCVLKYDHHCPWLNQCVGIGNERYFVLFMTWLSIGCAVVSIVGWSAARKAVEFSSEWPYDYTPRVFVILLYVLAIVMGLALGVMAGWQLILIARGETSVESNDNTHYREVAKRRGQTFINVYDVGARKNLELFFNVGEGSPHSYWTIMLPIRINPYTDGWHFAKKRGLRGRHAGIRAEEELTDEELESEDEIDKLQFGKATDAATHTFERFA